MFRKATAVLGTSVQFLDTIIFASIATGVIPKVLFQPFGAAILGATLPGPFIEETTYKIVFKSLGYAPAALIGLAVFVPPLEPMAAAFFTASISTHYAIHVGQFIYKRYVGEEITREEVVDNVIALGKTASILSTITIGGVGKAFELIETGVGLTRAHQVASASAAAISFVNGFKGLFMFGKSISGESQAVAEMKDEGFVLLGDGGKEIPLDSMETGQRSAPKAVM